MAKKRESKNLVLPILAVSLFATLGITVYLNRPTPTPLRIAEVTAPASNCASVAFTDNFSGTTVDATKWSKFSTIGTNSVANNTLTFSIPSGNPNSVSDISSYNKVEIEGDFIQEVTLNSLNNVPSTSTNSSFILGVTTQDDTNLYRIEIYKNGDIQSYAVTNSITTPGTARNVFKDTPTKLKISRAGNRITTYYDTGDGYIQHSSFTDIYSGKVFIQLFALSHSPVAPAVTAVVKDFSLKCRPPLPTGLDHSCSADGKTVSLKWDDNSPSKKYSVALNDPSENSENVWYKANTTDVWRGGDYDKTSYELPVIPGRNYEWWVITNSNGPFSDQSDLVKKSFTCTTSVSAPLNPRFTCNPDGKSVRLQWDGVTDVDSYKVRLDDKNGKVTNYDNLKDPQYIATVVPDKMYSFWVHSHKGGLDSNQSTAIDFTCKATATPTPKPTVKATAKPASPKGGPTSTPISKGDVVPTDTPAPSIKATLTPKSSPTNPSYVAPTPTPSPVETVSTNPVSRFFRWLAGLFE